MAAGPIIRIKFDPEILAKLGDVKGAAKVAKEQLRDLERELKQTAKTAKYFSTTVPQADVAAVQNAQARLAKYKELAKAEKDMAVKLRRMNKDISETNSSLVAVKSALTGSIAKKLISGQGLDFGDLATAGVLAERSILNAVRKIFPNESKRLLPHIRGLIVAAPIIGEAINAISDARDRIKQELDDAKEVGRQFEAGRISQSAFKFFTDRAERQVLFDLSRPKDELSAAQAAAAGLDKLSGKQLTEALSGAIKDVGVDKTQVGLLIGAGVLTPSMGPQIAEAIGFQFGTAERQRKLLERLTPQVFQDRIQARIEKEMEETHRSTFSADEIKALREDAIFSVFNELNTEAAKSLTEALSKQIQENIERFQIETAAKKYRESEEKKVIEYLAASREKRFSAQATMGQIFYIGD